MYLCSHVCIIALLQTTNHSSLKAYSLFNVDSKDKLEELITQTIHESTEYDAEEAEQKKRPSRRGKRQSRRKRKQRKEKKPSKLLSMMLQDQYWLFNYV